MVRGLEARNRSDENKQRKVKRNDGSDRPRVRRFPVFPSPTHPGRVNPVLARVKMALSNAFGSDNVLFGLCITLQNRDLRQLYRVSARRPGSDSANDGQPISRIVPTRQEPVDGSVSGNDLFLVLLQVRAGDS